MKGGFCGQPVTSSPATGTCPLSQGWYFSCNVTGNLNVMQKYHLLPDGEKWTVTREGPHAPIARFASKRVAVERVAEFLCHREASLKIHKPDGTVEEE